MVVAEGRVRLSLAEIWLAGLRPYRSGANAAAGNRHDCPRPRCSSERLPGPGQNNCKSAPLAQLAFDGDGAAVYVFDDVLGQRQAQTRAWGHVAVFLDAVELLEYSLAVFFAQSDSRVLHLEADMLSVGLTAQDYFASLGSVLEGVGQQVQRRLKQHVAVGQHAQIHRA